MKSTFNNLIVILCLFAGIQASGQPSRQITDLIEYRPLGPYRTGSWVSAIAVPPTTDPAYAYTFYVAGRNGGVWKTVNNGTSFFPVFDSVGVSSIGAIAVSKSDPDVVWVGTGEAFNARSSHAGNGIYKSENGGRTWQHMGLEDAFHIPKVIVHPGNPDVVWVASMGHLFTPNNMRGVFKTTDGGKTWKKTLYIDENTGVTDLIINPENPDILFAATYEKYRYPWHFEAGGMHSGIYRSDDGGETWGKIGSGLPGGKLGRIGLALCHSQPEIVYAVIENLNAKNGGKIDESIGMNHLRDNYYDQMVGGELYRSGDGGKSWEKRNDSTCNLSAKAAYSFNRIMVASDNPEIIYITSDLMQYSEDGGKTWPDCTWPSQVLSTNIFGDHRCLWMDPEDGRHVMFGSDGGLYESFDRGKTFTHHEQIPLGEIYNVETDNAWPYNIYLGLQDHEVWKGPSNSWSGQIGPEDWVITGRWDGMYSKVDQRDNRWLYTSTQFGGQLRVDQLLGERVDIEPKAAEGQPKYRYCWTPPLELSPQNPDIVYTGGQMLLRSSDRGDTWEEISPDLTTNNPEKINGKGHMMYCTITTISVSQPESGLIWAGTDDGRVWMTPDNGNTWNEFTDAIANLGGDKDLWVSRVVASPHKAGKAYVCKSGFRNDDFRPLVFKTTDYGKTWEKITDGLPNQPVNVITEDPAKEGLLYLGNDLGVFVSFDDGKSWQPLNANMPPVPVKDLEVQADAADLVVGTYGRGAFIADVWPLEQSINSNSQENYLLPVAEVPQRNCSERAFWGNYEQTGDNHLRSRNEPNGLKIYYFLNDDQKDAARIEIFDPANQPIDTLDIDQDAGYHKIIWDTWDQDPGTYTVKLISGKTATEQRAVIKPSPVWPVGHGLWLHQE